MRNNNFSVREEDEFICETHAGCPRWRSSTSLIDPSILLTDHHTNLLHLVLGIWHEINTFFFLSLHHYLRMYRYWKKKFLLAPSWEWKGFISDRFLLFCETNIYDLFLKLCNNFLGSSLLFPVYFIVSWEHAWLYMREDMTYGPEATQSSSRNSDLGPV